MTPIEIHIGFYPRWRSLEGVFGHCDAWFCTEDGTWVFLDPQGKGMRIHVVRDEDDIMDQLVARNQLCSEILILPAEAPNFRFPLFPALTCASVVGALVGIRALTPSGLRRRLLAKGARHATQGRPASQG